MEIIEKSPPEIEKLIKRNQKASRLIISLSAVGLIFALVIISVAPFRNGLFSLLFPKKYSLAAGPNDWAQVQKDPQRSGFSPETLGTSWKVKWTYAFQPERVYPQVQAIVYSGSVYVGTEMGNLYAIDAATGSKRWSFTAGGPILSSVAADNGLVYFGAMDGTFYAVNTSSGTLGWKTNLSNKGFSSSPILADNKVMVGGRDGNFYGLDPNTGNKLWTYNAGAPILQTAAWDNGKAFFGDLYGAVHGIKSADGTFVWKQQTGVAAFKDYWPVVTQGKVVIRGYAKLADNAGVVPGVPFGWIPGGNPSVPGTGLNFWSWLSQNNVAIAAGNATSVPAFISVQDNIINSYNSNPAAFADKKSMFILDENTGQEGPTAPSFDQQTLGGSPPSPCVDRDGKLVVPTMFIESGWGRLDLNYKANQAASPVPRITDVLYDGKNYQGQPMDLTGSNVVGLGGPAGFGNGDENLSVSCSQNMVLGFHFQEGNANYTGYFNLDTRRWAGLSTGPTNHQMEGGIEHDINPPSISNGMVYHIAVHELIARETGVTPSIAPSPTPTPTVAPTVIPTPVASPSASPTPAAAAIELLGNPTKAQWPDGSQFHFARNVWDMQVFNNKIYLGSGDAFLNAGPVSLWYYDLASNTFKTDSSSGTACGNNCVDEEQIDTFRSVNGELLIPGFDPRGADNPGNFYRYSGSTWNQIKKIPFGTHTFDLHYFDNKLFATRGGTANVSLIYSTDNGQTWTDIPGGCTFCFGARMYSMFELGGKLYASFTPFTSYFAEYQGNNTFVSKDAAAMFPGGSTASYVRRPVTFAGQLVYIGAVDTANFDWIANGLYKSSAFGSATAISLPNGAKAWDLMVADIVSGSKVYALGAIPSGSNYIVTVSSSSDLTNWTEVLRFNYTTFARSFEYLNGYFYFGMGSEATPLPTSVGDILRWRYP